jgi:aspartyl-tRNA(Asn)/glutamyl-tRNA(Gln) amidotransferase subunit A
MKYEKMEVWPTLKSLISAADGSATAKSLEQIRFGDEKIKSFLSLSPHHETPSPKNNLPLAGVPVAIKDNIAVKGLPLTCASKVLENNIAAYDATAVSRLKNAGAVIVGKTNMDEFAMGSSTENSAFHKTSNPWSIDHVPGGSSGGSAAAVAAGFVPVALGSDTGGSVRLPASFCGIVGFKPSYGTVSRFGLVAYGSSLDQIGIMSRYVEDVDEIYSLISGRDPMDESSVALPPDPLERKRNFSVAVIREFLDNESISANTREAILQGVDSLRSLGHQVTEVSLPFLNDAVIPAYYLTACAEASSNLSRFDGVRFGSRDGGFHLDSEAMTRKSRSLFGSEVKLRICLGNYILRAGHYDRFYGKAQAARHTISQGFTRAFKEIDFFLLPNFPTTAFPFGEYETDPLAMKLADLFTVTANLAGLPAISLPVGLANGLPTSLQLMGPRFTDHSLLRISRSLEKKLDFLRFVH